MGKQKKNNRPKIENNRKTIRKQKRQQKKINRQEHYLNKKNVSFQAKEQVGKYVRRPAVSLVSEPVVKKRKPQTSVQDIVLKERQKEMNEANKLKQQMEDQRKQLLLEANEEEDKVIKNLEKRLGLNKSKNKNNYFADDGLDYLLEVCDKSTTEQIVAAEKHLAEVESDSDFEDDLAVVTGKEKKVKKDKVKNAKVDTVVNKKSDVNSETDKSDDETDDEVSNDDFGEEMEEDSELYENSDIDEDTAQSDDSEPPEEKPITSKRAVKKTSKAKPLEKKEEATEKRKKSKKETKTISEEALSKVFSDDEVSHLSDDNEEDLSEDEDGGENSNEPDKKEKPDVWEDIYGRKRDKEGNVIKEEKGAYVPPHLRNKDPDLDKELLLLKKQIKSVLNKLAGTNLHWACSSIEKLYSENSRHSMNSSLYQLWTEAMVGPSVTPDRMLAEHAALIHVLVVNIGSEMGAHFLVELTKRFHETTLSPQKIEDKRLDNLVSCLAHLFTFKVCQPGLIYDILNRLLEDLTEKNIECILVVLRIAGGVLRKEEPLALKEFIQGTQEKVVKINHEAAAGSRVKFLLEVLMAVKNNNLKKIPNYDPSYTDHLKKMTRAIIKPGGYIFPLNIRLLDVVNLEKSGKWWLVGSAWEGNNAKQEVKEVPKAHKSDEKLLELARKQRMNTDVRRSIFCVIMSAEDYMDAFEKLQHLGLKGQQEREIIHVLLACCLQEKTYNPYYAVLGQKLCDTDRKYQLSIQYSVWDKIKDIENLPKHATTNLAQFLIHLFMEKGLPLSVLKIIQFSELNKPTLKFMRQILLAIIMNEDFQSALEVFNRVSKPPKLHVFRESLKLFIQHFLIKNADKKTGVLSEEEMATLKTRAIEVEKILTMFDSKLKL